MIADIFMLCLGVAYGTGILAHLAISFLGPITHYRRPWLIVLACVFWVFVTAYKDACDAISYVLDKE